ncbi:hypothetical protein GII36_05755 [Candidatus Mycosynbacter amalyticus]|uniref:Glycosyltransferase RgtA/B/C/D-like domain-containing protein n=1 Tax=Candidatus Mycosynbacter amalyticus TaxID=2665156 RepID=A0A857ML64_9BACT|nr:hypothetical protein [Candidatus Mycosynbacter amalyticus]QHN43323.1 hypothetical protein GII36_05755 [Candidatus Mycosynbacter amalyticus]
MIQRGNTAIWRQWWLLVAAMVGLFVSILLFYPGMRTTDTVWQLCQATGDCQLDTWHPIAMALVWSGLIYVMGGNDSGLLLLQQVFLWSGLYVFAALMFGRTRSVAKALAVFALAFVPSVLAVSGVLWKDTQMGTALLLAASLTWLLRTEYITARWLRISIATITPLLLIYAIALRVNAVAAVLPLMWLYADTLLPQGSKRRSLMVSGVTVGIAIGSLIFVSLLGYMTHAYKSSSTVTMYALDIVNIVPSDEIQRTAPANVRDKLVRISGCSLYAQPQTKLATWEECSGGFKNETGFHDAHVRRELVRYWTQVVSQHPARYMAQKVETYMQFLFPDESQMVFPRQDETKLTSRATQSILYSYTVNFGYANFRFIYAAWFWVAVSLLCAVYITRRHRRSTLYSPIIVMLASSMLNILSYAPGSIVTDARFLYWSMLATSISVLFVWFVVRNAPRSILRKTSH